MEREKILLLEGKRDELSLERLAKIRSNKLVASCFDIHAVFTAELPDHVFGAVHSAATPGNGNHLGFPTNTLPATIITCSSSLIFQQCAACIEFFHISRMLIYDGPNYRLHQDTYYNALTRLHDRYPWIRIGKYGKNGPAFKGSVPSVFDRGQKMKKLEGYIRQSIFL